MNNGSHLTTHSNVEEFSDDKITFNTIPEPNLWIHIEYKTNENRFYWLANCLFIMQANLLYCDKCDHTSVHYSLQPVHSEWINEWIVVP